MAGYPPVTDAEKDAALRRIRVRHERREDPYWCHGEANGPGDAETAYRVLAYLARRHQPDHAPVPAGVGAADVWDELILSAWCWWDHKSRERELLARAQRYGLSLSELGAFLGIRSRQGVRDYLDRGAALLDERARIAATPRHAAGDGATTALICAPTSALTRLGGRTRAERGADVHATRATRRAAREQQTQRRWISEHQPVITATLDRLLGECARLGLHRQPRPHPRPEPNPDGPDRTDNLLDDPVDQGFPRVSDSPGHGRGGGRGGEVALGDSLTWLAEDLAGDAVTEASFGALGLVLGELRSHPVVAAQPANHGIHQAIRAADRLRAEYATPAAHRH